jgi:hypothetical protein
VYCLWLIWMNAAINSTPSLPTSRTLPLAILSARISQLLFRLEGHQLLLTCPR